MQDLHDKGLIEESKTLSDHLTENDEWPSYWWVIPGLIIGLLTGFLIGVRFNSKDEIDLGEDTE